MLRRFSSPAHGDQPHGQHPRFPALPGLRAKPLREPTVIEQVNRPGGVGKLAMRDSLDGFRDVPPDVVIGCANMRQVEGLAPANVTIDAPVGSPGRCSGDGLDR
jgi:hypothetical protein